MADQDTNTNPTPATPEAPPATQAEQQTFSAEYVSELRREAARYRTRATEVDTGLRKAFGLEPDADCSDMNALLTARDGQTTAKALEKANTRLITAEIKGLQGYNTALLERLIDRGSIKVGDDGVVTGAKEAAEAAAKQFPAVLTKTQSREQWAPKNPAAGDPPEKKPSEMTYDEFAAYVVANAQT